jgi:hypothetical protein
MKEGVYYQSENSTYYVVGGISNANVKFVTIQEFKLACVLIRYFCCEVAENGGLKYLPEKKITIIKALREALNIGLAEAKYAFEAGFLHLKENNVVHI